MLSPASRSRTAVNIWPGFVDALASVLLVFIFMLLVFVLAQFVLSDLASNRFGAIEQLSSRINALLDELAVQKERGRRLEGRVQALDAELAAARGELRDADATIERQREAAAARERELASLEGTLSDLRDQAAAREQAIADLREREASLEGEVHEREALLEGARAREADAARSIERLNAQIGALREQLARVAAALELSEERNEQYKVQVDELGQKLNIALAERVEELGRFRSDFFGRLREVLGERGDIRIVGDRFVFQSEVLFPSGSDALEPAGRAQLDRLAETLKEVAAEIPEDVDWILRVDGHTDRRPISTPEFPSNWELSTARALSIVRHLIDAGIPPRRLAATGFAHYRPIDTGDRPEALARNRRIELKITGP